MNHKYVKAVWTVLAIALLFTPALGMANPDLANAKDCFSCHSVDEKIIGPSYKDVAAKYSGNSDAEAMLIKKVMKGGGGTWGKTWMPANKNVSEDEARRLISWVLSQNK